MGYVRKPLQIIGGGFTCLPPPDKIPITDYLLAQNFRTDSLGRLISRPGYALKIAMATGGIAHSAACGFQQNEYFVGANANTDGSGGTVWYGGIGGSQIASGFDGNRVGFSTMNGFMWIMNRGRQGRSKGAGSFETWTLLPPPVSPVLSKGGPAAASDHTVYTYAPQPQPYTHFLSIGGNTYSFPELGYGPDQVALVVSIIAKGDPNCAVTYPGSGQQITIAPIAADAVIPVSGSDGNPAVNLSLGATPADAPQGTYVVYWTYQSADMSLESNPGPASNPISIDNETIVVTIPAAAVPTDPRVGFLNIYVSGGKLPEPYRVAQLPWTNGSSPTTFTWTVDEDTAVNAGVVMPTDNDPPPACAGMVGPHFGRLYAWSTRAHGNRLFWTPPGQPQYWPGANDEQEGNWVDVGLDDEAIVWCTLHNNLIVIYKERSIWMMIGTDPSTAQLERAYEGPGVVNQWALTSAGQIDYFVAPNGLKLFDMAMVHDLSGDILPIFNQTIFNGGPLDPPGSILPGGTVNQASGLTFSAYAVALGHAFDRLFVSYAEQGAGGTQFVLLVFDEGPAPEGQTLVQRSGRWFYERNSMPNTLGFFGFLFDGTYMLGLTGEQGANAAGYSLADFQSRVATDYNLTLIECVYGSHYEDCGLPDNDKQWLEAVIDYEYATGGQAADVYLGFNAGKIAPQKIGQLQGSARQSVAFAPGQLPGGKDGAYLARSMAVMIDAQTGGRLVIHNVFFYYYAEERTAHVASTIPTDLGVGKIKECREIELDIDATPGGCTAAVVSDMPGHALTTRFTAAIAQGGRSLWRYPFQTTQGYLWQITIGGPSFRLYSARMLMRVLEIGIEGYETAQGFVWDSMEQALRNGDVSTLDAVRFEMDSDGACSVKVFTDLPGEQPFDHGTYVLTTGQTKRGWVLVPIPDGIEARSVRLQVTGAGFRLYKAQARHSAIGRYLAGMTPSGTDDSFRQLEVDYHAERFSMFKRLEIDMRADDTVNAEVWTDQDTQPLALMLTAALTTTGRAAQVITFPPGIRGRLMRVKLWSDHPARVYHMRVWTRAVTDPNAAWVWADVPLEGSEILPSWVDFIAEETSPVWKWVDLDMAVSQ